MAIKHITRIGWEADKAHPQGGVEILKEIELTSLRAIRHKCLDCSAWQPPEVRLCPNKTCALWPFRMGKSGNKKNLTEEQRQAMSDRAKNLFQ